MTKQIYCDIINWILIFFGSDILKLLCIDGNSIINRAFYGIKLLTTKDGLYTNAVYGFINILNRLIETEKPEGVAVAFDLKKPTFRHLKYAEYKAGSEIEVEDSILGNTEVSDWAKEGFAWVVENGIITGIETETGLELAPTDGSVRAQLATIMMRYCDNYTK